MARQGNYWAWLVTGIDARVWQDVLRVVRACEPEVFR